MLNTYGLNWTEIYPQMGELPEETAQTIIELKSFIAACDGNATGDIEDSWLHAERAARLIWPKEEVEWEAEYKGKSYENFFLKEAMKELCREREVMFTGPASCGKTFPASLYVLLRFFAEPDKTTIIFSTTSSRGADVRMWSQTKALFNAAKFKVGTPIEYIKSITFDVNMEMGGSRDVSQRDLRNGIMVMTVPPGSEGRNAVRNIIGIKQKGGYVIWAVDELPEMVEGIFEETVANLESNEFFQLIGLGNASRKTDSHGDACEPMDGWGIDLYNKYYGGRWQTKTGGTCVFFDGMKSPNRHKELLSIKKKSDLPFPYLSNHITDERNAFRYGHGNPEIGVITLQYMRMNRGIWPDDGVEQTVLSESYVKNNNADDTLVHWGMEPRTILASCDPAFTAGGDDFDLLFGELGRTYEGQQALVVDKEILTLHPLFGEEYTAGMARQVVAECKKRKVKPRNFAIDVSSDGGKIAQAIMREWDSHDCVLISSMGRPTERPASGADPRPSIDVYDRQVTEYWMSVRTAVTLGLIKNFNVRSQYARDLFRRVYSAVGADKVSIETKKDMKKRARRSPDAGDAFCYLVEIARQRGLNFSPDVPEFREKRIDIDPLTLRLKDQHDDSFEDDYATATAEDPWEW